MTDFQHSPKTDPDLIESIHRTPTPMNKYVEFGAKIPTPFVVKYKGRKSRVFRAKYPDFQGLWIRNDKEQVFLDTKTADRLFKEL